ncbi:hypothetical protein DBV15_11955 [Temnothorax longispinosus]|uniref:CCHC-type domain-containing protein n=1 Tax=Temnothorax longispinosus TaxID=300112 RepID=A0A4S2KXV8_9HYME|nr:hypothetical protein DBV15_11955 [Temnothorax longispinosus]
MFVTAPMSHAQSPSHEQAITLSLLLDKMTRMTDAIQDLKNQIEELQIDRHKDQLPSRNLSVLEVQRDTCIQRHNETVDDFINRFFQIHNEIITTLKSRKTGIIPSRIQEEIYQKKAIEVFCRNIKPKIGSFLYSFELDTLNQAFSKAKIVEGGLQLRKLQMQCNKAFKKPRFQPKEGSYCNYCKKRGHEENDCRTKAHHQRRQ